MKYMYFQIQHENASANFTLKITTTSAWEQWIKNNNNNVNNSAWDELSFLYLFEFPHDKTLEQLRKNLILQTTESC